jgi:hypothetical protein
MHKFAGVLDMHVRMSCTVSVIWGGVGEGVTDKIDSLTLNKINYPIL